MNDFQGQWQPIETSPKNKSILVCGGVYRTTSDWSDGWDLLPGVSLVSNYDKYDGYWEEGESCDEYQMQYKPKYWMPLPEPKE